MPSLKIISLNIEGSKHLNIQEDFFSRQSPHVVCLQEIFEDTYIYLKDKFKLEGSFAPMWKRPSVQNTNSPFAVMGIAFLTNCEIKKIDTFYYNGSVDKINNFIPGKTSQDLLSRAVIVAAINYNGIKYTIGTTHFTWSENGLTSTQQQRDIDSLLKILGNYQEIVFCGDFNAPRGKDIFEKISVNYVDNIPKNYTTSIDGNLHYAGHLDLMVDGLFSTRGYEVSNVKLISGVSDHCAIVANIRYIHT